MGIWERVLEILAEPRTPEGVAEILDTLGQWIEDSNESERADFTDVSGIMVPFRYLSEDLRRMMVNHLMEGIAPETAEAFHLTDLMYQICPTFDRDTWRDAKAVRSPQRLIIRGYQVMDAWETPIMHAMVDTSLAECRAQRPRVLEIGWGMGISGRRYLEAGVDYTVVEAHPELAKAAGRAVEPFGGRVVEGFWEDTHFDDGSFDIVFFDAYHATHDPNGSYLVDSARHFYPTLAAGGVFETFAHDVLARIDCMHACGFERVICRRIEGFVVPRDCTYFPPHATGYVDTTGIKP